MFNRRTEQNFKRKKNDVNFKIEYLYIKEKMEDLRKFIATTIREYLNENYSNLKNVNVEFEIIKNSHWSSLKKFTLNDIVNGWVSIQNIDNDNIKTIKYFVDNPQLLKKHCLSYDKKGLADGYHRLTAMKIIGLDKFCYKYEDEYSGD